eukprot:gb/GECG01001116.1/.p1 GENE.gb/GECG01001116.1/~~gb/GECG01001116.1/.p1  ORF type:complete len:129 (+),score=5.44 gb/GECG01001116.1/:1-387(+)
MPVMYEENSVFPSGLAFFGSSSVTAGISDPQTPISHCQSKYRIMKPEQALDAPKTEENDFSTTVDFALWCPRSVTPMCSMAHPKQSPTTVLKDYFTVPLRASVTYTSQSTIKAECSLRAAASTSNSRR